MDNSYARDLPGTYLAVKPAPAPAPRLLRFNAGLARDLGLPLTGQEAWLADLFAGNALPPDAEPLAQAYAGHQFGGFSPQLGDGRALLLGEVVAPDGRRFDLQFKGSGRTPFSRGGDGKAAVGPVLREYLIGEAMAALGVPTTRALAAVATGEPVFRETELPGAVLTRVAASHLRVGTFQFFAARKDAAQVRALADYAIRRHHPEAAGAENPHLALFDAVAAAQARLVAQWMALGFIHGVMNTDNMTISGETIDYGPCAFMEAYAPGTVFSSIDRQGRYAYANQPLILVWNLARLAEAMLGLFSPDADRAIEIANDRLQAVTPLYEAEWLRLMRAKLGLAGEGAGADEGAGAGGNLDGSGGDRALAEDLLALMQAAGADWTMTFRALSRATEDDGPVLAILGSGGTDAARGWLARWRRRIDAGSAARMRAANPAFIPRNHLVEEALAAATAGDMAPFERLLAVITRPFDDQQGQEAFALPAPTGFTEGYRTFCGT
nr:YdiU family protein [Gemmobacter aestuarii]